MSKFFNPLDVEQEPVSVSSTKEETVLSASSAFNIEDPNTCPKCNSATCMSSLASGERVMFCTNCRVSMAIPLK